jgi:hypothetical protein
MFQRSYGYDHGSTPTQHSLISHTPQHSIASSRRLYGTYMIMVVCRHVSLISLVAKSNDVVILLRKPSIGESLGSVICPCMVDVRETIPSILSIIRCNGGRWAVDVIVIPSIHET